MAKGRGKGQGQDAGTGDAWDCLMDNLDDADMEMYQEELLGQAVSIRATPTGVGLSTESIKLAIVSMDPRVERSVSEWCRVAGVHRSTYYAWCRDERWLKFRGQLFDSTYGELLPELKAAMRASLKFGDVKAIRLMHELRGDLVKRVETTHVHETPEQRAARRRLQDRARGQQEQPADGPH